MDFFSRGGNNEFGERRSLPRMGRLLRANENGNGVLDNGKV